MTKEKPNDRPDPKNLVGTELRHQPSGQEWIEKSKKWPLPEGEELNKQKRVVDREEQKTKREEKDKD